MFRKILWGIPVLILLNTLAFPWGDQGHRLITRKAFDALPSSMKFLSNYKEEIVAHVVDPDYRKKTDKSEDPKHYIDIDFYKEFQNGKMLYNKDELISIYGKEKVEDMGLLPWAIQETVTNLESAFKSMSKQKIILYASDLAHYIGDAHQPLHAVTNYDGKLTGQKGIHARYEIKMIDSNLVELEKDITPRKAVLISDIKDEIFNVITASCIYADVLLTADKFSVKASGDEYNTKYYELLWFRTKHLSVS